MNDDQTTLQSQVEFLEHANHVLNETIVRIIHFRDTVSLCREIFRVLRSVLSLDAGYIDYYDPDHDTMDTIYEIDEDLESIEINSWDYKKSVVSMWIVEKLETVRLGDLHRDIGKQFPNYEIRAFGKTEKISRSWMSVPLKVNDLLIGVLNIQSYQADIYGENEQEFLEVLSNVIAIAISNTTMVNKLETRISELNLPYIVFDNETGIVPLVDGLNVERLNAFVERILGFVVEFSHEHVLFDLSAITTYDEYLVQSLSTVIQALELSGSNPILIGMHPNLIEGLVHMGISFEGIGIARDLAMALAMR